MRMLRWQTPGSEPAEKKSKKDKRPVGEATKSYLLALVHSLTTVLPFDDLSPWQATAWGPLDGASERVLDPVEGRYYMHDMAKRSHPAAWCLPIEVAKPVRGVVRVLVFMADEGSEGYSLYQFLAWYGKLRVMFHRDPLHKLSNNFTTGLRSVPRVIAGVYDIQIVHKWTRAPHGTGRFRRAALEALEVLLDNADENHELIMAYGAAIARDHQLPPEAVVGKKGEILRLLEKATQAPMSQRVEMRRWFTFYEAGWPLLQMWHSLLLALLAEFAFDGKNPWDIIAAAPKPGEATDETFAYKVDALRTLASPMNNFVLRSVLVVNRLLKDHHRQYDHYSQLPEQGLKFQLLWADECEWVRTMVVPTLQDALGSRRWVPFLGLRDPTHADAPLCGPLPDDATEEAEMLVLHLRNVMGVVAQQLEYASLWQAPPWCFVGLLSPNVERQRATLQQMRRIWDLFLRLHGSYSLIEHQYHTILFFQRWAVVREVCGAVSPPGCLGRRGRRPVAGWGYTGQACLPRGLSFAHGSLRPGRARAPGWRRGAGPRPCLGGQHRVAGGARAPGGPAGSTGVSDLRGRRLEPRLRGWA